MNAASDLEAIHVFVATNDTVEPLASTSEFAQPPAESGQTCDERR
jgi:hypothetical protein